METTTKADASMRLAQSLLEHIGKGVLWIDSDNCCVFANDFARSLLGQSPEELEQALIQDIIPTLTPNKLDEYRIRSRDGGMATGESLVSKKPSKPVQISFTIRSFKFESKQYLCLFLVDANEQNSLKEQIQERNAQLRSMVHHSQDWECWFGVDNQLLWVNPAAVNISGYSLGELIGMQDFPDPLISKDHFDNIKQIFESSFKTRGSGKGIEFELVRKDGEKVWVEMAWQTLVGGKDEFFGTRYILRDISQRKNAEKELTEQSQFLRSLIEAIPTPLFFKDTTLRYRFFNKPFSEVVIGKPATEIIGKTVLEAVGDEAREYAVNYDKQDRELLRKGGTQHYEGPLIFADGVKRDVMFAKALLCGPDGNQIGIVGVLSDITDYRKAQEKLRSSEERVHKIIEASAAGYYRVDPSGAFLDANQAFLNILGYSSFSELAALTMESITREEDRGLLRHQLQQVFSGETVASGEVVVRHKDRTIGHISFTASPIFVDGKVAQAEGFVIDTGPLRQLQMQLAQTHKLEAIGHLAAGIAHEINSPIQFVSDNTRFLQTSFGDLMTFVNAVRSISSEKNETAIALLDEKLSDLDLEFLNSDVPQAISESLEGLNRVTKIVRAMKEFSHPGKEDKAPVDLNAGIENTTTICRNEWKYVSDLELNLDPNLPRVPGFAARINQVILNLVVNAADAITEVTQSTPGSRGKITVSTKPVGNFAEIRISDTGNGIPDFAKDHIFDPFYTTKEPGQGSGQGLSIAHSIIVDQHKGSLDFETELGTGTTFIIRLPIQDIK